MAFTLPQLPYAYDALEPAIDARTMEIHHTKHHNAYLTNLNNAINGTDLAGKSIEQILAGEMSPAVRNNGGGFYNHNLFWEILTPGGSAFEGPVAEAIKADLGGFDSFKAEFANAATTRFGSGWAWLIVKADGKLAVVSSPNQDNPLMTRYAEVPGTPILGLDVWEHAYYLNYQNRRPDYIQAFFGLIDWAKVGQKYQAARG